MCVCVHACIGYECSRVLAGIYQELQVHIRGLVRHQVP